MSDAASELIEMEKADEPKPVEAMDAPCHDEERGVDEEKGIHSTSTIIDWNGPDDPENPSNMSLARKWAVTIALSLLNLSTTFASSVFSPAGEVTAREFHVSSEVMILATSLYLTGFIAGPFVFGPLSELYGRKIPLFTGFLIFALFQIPVAVAHNLQSIMIFRFFQGVFGSAAQAITGGALADFWSPRERGFAMPAFAASLSIGPIFGPIVGAFIVDSTLGWRWTQWITCIMAFFFGTIALLTYPETHGPTLLTRRASRLRHKTKNWALHSLHEEKEVSLQEIAGRYLFRPFKMLAQEPILLLVSLYMSFTFGLLYLCFGSYPISFSEGRHFSAGVGTLPLIAVLIGCALGCLLVSLTTKTKLAPDPDQGRLQETRLILMAVGGASLPVGLFWFAWTSFPSINPWPEIISGVPIGFGLMLLILQGMNYIIDTYMMYANSALAANTSMRYCFAAGFPLFTPAMYHNLGVQWASSVLAFIALALLPLPVLFYRYGARIRQRSRFVPA